MSRICATLHTKRSLRCFKSIGNNGSASLVYTTVDLYSKQFYLLDIMY